jgi:hypothetical protein
LKLYCYNFLPFYYFSCYCYSYIFVHSLRDRLSFLLEHRGNYQGANTRVLLWSQKEPFLLPFLPFAKSVLQSLHLFTCCLLNLPHIVILRPYCRRVAMLLNRKPFKPSSAGPTKQPPTSSRRKISPDSQNASDYRLNVHKLPSWLAQSQRIRLRPLVDHGRTTTPQRTFRSRLDSVRWRLSLRRSELRERGLHSHPRPPHPSRSMVCQNPKSDAGAKGEHKSHQVRMIYRQSKEMRRLQNTLL